MKKIIFLIFMIILFCPNVYAAEFNMNSYTSATLGGTKNRYRATENYNVGMSYVLTFGTRYNGRISDIETYFDYPFEANTTYTLTYNMATEDFRNNFSSSYWWDCDQSMTNTNATVQLVSYISYKKVKFTFTPTANTTCIRVWIKSANSSSFITGVNNWNLSSITLYDPDWQSGSGSGQGSTTPTPTPNSNQDIINNQNNNTQDIINNNNQNTQDIIENNNQNTQVIQDSINNGLSNCRESKNLLNFDSALESWGITYTVDNGVYTLTNIGYGYSRPYTLSNLEVGKTYILGGVKTTQNTTNLRLDLLKDGTNIKQYYFSGNIANSTSFTVESGSTYSIRINYSSASYPMIFSKPTLNQGSSPISFEPYGQQVCTSKIDDVTNSITNDDVDDNTGFFTNFQNNDHGLSSIITLPLSTIQSLANTSCVALNLPIPFTNDSIDLPCMSQIYDSYAHDIFVLWQVVSFGLISYYICLDIFKLVKGFKDPNEDKVEVLDL